MKKSKATLALALLLVLPVSCVTVVRAVDPAIIKAEDVLTNSLTAYTNAMNYHIANFADETPAIYYVLENFRVKFPMAWHAADLAKRRYQQDRSRRSAALEAALNTLSSLVASITVTPLIGIR